MMTTTKGYWQTVYVLYIHSGWLEPFLVPDNFFRHVVRHPFDHNHWAVSKHVDAPLAWRGTGWPCFSRKPPRQEKSDKVSPLRCMLIMAAFIVMGIATIVQLQNGLCGGGHLCRLLVSNSTGPGSQKSFNVWNHPFHRHDSNHISRSRLHQQVQLSHFISF